MRSLEQRVLAGCQVMQRRVFNLEVTLTHRASHVDYRMTRSACEARLSFGGIDLLFNRLVKPAVEKDRVIVAACAPFGRRRPYHVLHVLDGLAVPLVVKGRKVMHRSLPLFVY